MALTKDDIHGIMPPLVTPFDADDAVDEEAYRREVNFMVGLGVDGLVCGGSTGEGAALTLEEARRLYAATVEEVRGRVPVIGGVITNTTVDAVARAKAARDAGMDAVMVTPVSYPASRPDDNGIVEFFRDIWEQVGLPIIVYNVLEHAPVRLHLWPRLVEIPGMVGVKESAGGNLETLTEIIDLVGDRVAVTFASDPILLPGYAIGAVGTISGINSVLPEMCLEQWRAMERGDILKARELHFRLHKVNRHIHRPNWNSRIKAAINLQDRKAGKARAPQQPLSDAERSDLAKGLSEAGVMVAV